MRTSRTFLAAATLIAAGLLSSAASAQTFTGNGGTGFGGVVGTSTITVAETTPGTINFTLTPTTGSFGGNALILYVDSKTGGFGDTSLFTDTADGGRTAISGFNSQNNTRTLARFATGFAADFAITVEPGSFSGLFDLSTPASFGFVASGGISGTGPVTFSFTRAQLGLPTTGATTFDFLGSLISTNAYRSNETLGTSVTVPGTLGDTPNAGFLGTTTFTTANTAILVPEPTTLALVGGLAAAALRRRK